MMLLMISPAEWSRAAVGILCTITTVSLSKTPHMDFSLGTLDGRPGMSFGAALRWHLLHTQTRT